MLKQFFIICSGADTDILNQSSKGEQNKYSGIGATVFFTAVMAFIAGSFALYTVFDSLYSSIFFGLIWGLLIFNLDRFIVSTIKKRDHFMDTLIQASPRIVLAIIIAIVISKPLELKIFEKEINQVLLEQKNELTLSNKTQIAEQFTPEIIALQHENDKLQNSIISKETEVNVLYNNYISEAEGTAGSKLLGKGPVYKEKREKHNALLLDLQQLKTDTKVKITANENKIVQLNNDYDMLVSSSQPIINNFDGLMARITALNKLPWLPSFFIFLLFLTIETAPIITKLLATKSEYDYKLETQDLALQTNLLQNKNQRACLLKTDFAINNRIYSAIENEDELYNYKMKKTRELMQLQTDAFFKTQKNSL